jgi:hypothetical protein
MGYKTQILEFIDMEHTPKNILIRAVKKKSLSVFKGDKLQSISTDNIKAEYEKLVQFLGVNPTLYKLLAEHIAPTNNKDVDLC